MKRLRTEPSSHDPFRILFSKETRPALIVFISILIGNFGYYFLRSHWVIALPSLKLYHGFTNENYADILTSSYVCNSIGKVVGGFFIDYTGRPKFSFVLFLLLTCCCALAATFAPTFTPIFILWSASRLFTTIGKMSVIKIVVSVFPPAIIGTAIGISVVSFNIGESLSRTILGYALRLFSESWREMFYVAIGCALVCIIPSAVLVKDASTNSPRVDFEEAIETDDKTSETVVHEPAKSRIRSFLMLFTNIRMILLMLLSIQITCLKEILGGWSINYLTDALGTPGSSAAMYTGLFCVCSAVGSLIGGRIIDSIPRRHRAAVNCLYIFGVGICACMLMLFNHPGLSIPGDPTVVSLLLISIAEFLMGPPISFVDGIYVVDLVDSSEVSFASGIVGCVGYVGPIVLNRFIGDWTREGEQRWELVYAWGLACSLGALVISCVYWAYDLYKASRNRTDSSVER